MVEDIILRYISLPSRIRGVTVKDEEGNYNIYLNALSTHEVNIETLRHEINHIKKNDFASDLHISKLEK